jgi:hypothetical protein
MQLRRRWLEPYTWQRVTDFNRALCAAKSALHKPTSDGHEKARILWESARVRELDLEEALATCLQCHRIAPFCFFNGNTFTVIARDFVTPLIDAISDSNLAEAATFRSIVGHYVAGTEGIEELRDAIRKAVTYLKGKP